MTYNNLWLSIIFSFLITSILGCNSFNDSKTVEMVSLAAGACPFPTGLSDVDKSKSLDLSGEIGGIVKYIGSADFESKINETLKEKYTQDTHIQMIYALTYSACVSCRVSEAKPTECMAAFKPIIDKYTKFLPESNVFSEYENYSERLLW